MIRTPNSLRRNYFKRKKKRHHHRKEVKNVQPTTPNYPVAAKPKTSTNDEATTVIPKTVNVTIHYVDSLGCPLLSPVEISGAYQSALTIPWQTIPSYVLASIHHFQKTFIPNPHGIYLVYAKQTAAPVVVYHRDTHGQLLSPPEFLKGNLNSDYTVQPLAGMQQFLQSVQPVTSGTFNKKTTQVNLTYETMQLSPLKVAQETYVRLLVQTPVFSQPDTTQPLEKPLPKASIWRVYQAVKEKTNARVWLNLGGFIWIIAQNIQQVDDYRPKLLAAPNEPLQLHYQIISDTPIQQQAVVNTGQNTTLTTWQSPYGAMLNLKLYPGEVITITHQLQLDNQSLWAQLDNGAFIEAKYISYI